MKDILLVLTVLWTSQLHAGECSHWDVYGVGIPKRIDGKQASYTEMLTARKRTLAYIERLQNTIDNCHLTRWQESELFDTMELAAHHYNTALYDYKQHHPEVAAANSTP